MKRRERRDGYIAAGVACPVCGAEMIANELYTRCPKCGEKYSGPVSRKVVDRLRAS